MRVLLRLCGNYVIITQHLCTMSIRYNRRYMEVVLSKNPWLGLSPESLTTSVSLEFFSLHSFYLRFPLSYLKTNFKNHKTKTIPQTNKHTHTTPPTTSLLKSRLEISNESCQFNLDCRVQDTRMTPFIILVSPIFLYYSSFLCHYL